MRFSFHPEAEREFDDAVAHYEQCQPGLGLEFADEVYAAIARIVRFPKAWPEASKRSRCCLVNRFPYGLIYQLQPGTVRIIGVAHLSRRPGYWMERE